MAGVTAQEDLVSPAGVGLFSVGRNCAGESSERRFFVSTLATTWFLTTMIPADDYWTNPFTHGRMSRTKP